MEKLNNASVRVSKCHWAARAQSYVSYDNFVNEEYPFIGEAMEKGKEQISAGRCVIVRPNYNETDELGNRFFREWRSFDGKPFEEVRFEIPR